MTMAVKKFEIVEIPDTDNRVAKVVYEDNTEAEFIVEKDESWHISIRKKKGKRIGETHYKLAKCSSMELAVNPRTTYDFLQVTCIHCIRDFDEGLAKMRVQDPHSVN